MEPNLPGNKYVALEIHIILPLGFAVSCNRLKRGEMEGKEETEKKHKIRKGEKILKKGGGGKKHNSSLYLYCILENGG